jgi:hypothetical protein
LHKDVRIDKGHWEFDHYAYSSRAPLGKITLS